ncbi:MAG: hypothetical protein ACK4IX_01430 [Candidatus Sericytochromatia bacterium]
MFVDVIKQDRKNYKEQGKLEGKKETLFQVVKNMIKNKIDFQLISTVTGLNIQEIEKISKE